MTETNAVGGNREPLPLVGLGVVVTRPAAQAEPMVERLQALGARVVRVPLLAIEPPLDLDAARAAVRAAATCDLAVFVSTNAVDHGLALLRETCGGIPAGMRLAAIGQATAQALETQARAPDLVPVSGFDSESLLVLEELQAERIQGQRVVIFRGNGGREKISGTLRSRGAEVLYAEVYRRVRPPVDVEALRTLGEAGRIDAIVVTSGESLSHLFDAFPRPPHHWLDRVALVVPSARVGEAAQRQGHRLEPVVASEAGDDALVRALVRWHQTRSQA